MYCEHCGAKLSDDARFCSVCGSKQEPLASTPPIQSTPPGTEYGRIAGAPRSTSSRTAYEPSMQSTSFRTAPPPPADRQGGGKISAAVIVAIILGAALAAVLGYLAWQHFRPDPGMSNGDAVVEETRPTAAPSFERESSGGVFSKPTEKPERSPKPERTPEPTAVPTPAPTPEPTPEPVSGYDPALYSTEDDPTLGDFLWANPDILQGNLPADREPLKDLSEASGGWKVYIIDDPDSGSYMERLCTAHVGSRDGAAALVLHSGYAHDGERDEGYMEEPVDSLFTGDWLDGGMEVVGAGRITIDEFFWMDGREFGVGTFMWPDGMLAYFLMARP